MFTIADSGPDDGFPVVVCSGSPGSRILDPHMIDIARRYGLRLIGWDRPGYGGAPPRPGHSVADVASDVAAITAELGISRCATWGASGGGAYALACAALLPDVVVAACLFAPLGPYGEDDFDFLAGMSAALADEVALHFADEGKARSKWRADVDQMMDALCAPESWFKRWGERAGTDTAHGIAMANYMAVNCAEALRSGDEGWWEDWHASLRPWGFRLEDVSVPVHLWHGSDDSHVPVAHGRYLASRLPQVVASFPAGADHTNIEELHRQEAMAWLSAAAAAAGSPRARRCRCDWPSFSELR